MGIGSVEPQERGWAFVGGFTPRMIAIAMLWSWGKNREKEIVLTDDAWQALRGALRGCGPNRRVERAASWTGWRLP